MERNAPQKQQFNSLIQMMRALPDEQAAIEHFTDSSLHFEPKEG